MVGSVYQVIDRSSGDVLGTAFTIFGRRVLTCKHVLADEPDFDRQIATGARTITSADGIGLFNSVELGVLSAVRWNLHDQLDIACGLLDEAIPRLPMLGVAASQIEIGTSVQCLGFPEANPDVLHTYERKVASYHADRGLVLDGALAPGMSGGPAMVNGQVVGIVYGDLADANISFLVPFARIASWLEATVPPVPDPGITWQKPADQLLSVSIALNGLTTADLRDVIKIFVKAVPQAEDAQALLDEAMVLRKKCNPEGFTDDQILVRTLDIYWNVPPRTFWTSVFSLCLARSRRTLAALFLASSAPDRAMLDDEDREVYDALAQRLNLTM